MPLTAHQKLRIPKKKRDNYISNLAMVCEEETDTCALEKREPQTGRERACLYFELISSFLCVMARGKPVTICLSGCANRGAMVTPPVCPSVIAKV